MFNILTQRGKLPDSLLVEIIRRKTRIGESFCYYYFIIFCRICKSIMRARNVLDKIVVLCIWMINELSEKHF